MSSPVRTSVTHSLIALAVTISVTLPVAAQPPAAQTSVAMAIRVRPTLEIHGVVATGR